MGNPKPYPIYWDHMLIDACQVTNPSIDHCVSQWNFALILAQNLNHSSFEGEAGNISLKTELAPQVKLDIPVVFAAMSYGAISLNAHKALAMAARRMGTLMNTGEGGLHEDLAGYTDRIIVQLHQDALVSRANT